MSSFEAHFLSLKNLAAKVSDMVVKNEEGQKKLYIEDFFDQMANTLFLRYPSLKKQM